MAKKTFDVSAELEMLKQLTFLDVFEPQPGHQEAVFQCRKHQLILGGGNKAGKTYCLCARSALRSIPEKDYHGENTGWLRDPYIRIRVPSGRRIRGWISSYSQNSQLGAIQDSVDKLFGPYWIEPPKHESGVYFSAKTEVADIQFKWITAGQISYTGDNIDWLWMDEPHPRNIYNEGIARTLNTKGYSWIGLTPVIDARDPDYAMKLRFIQWMAEEIIDVYDKDPDKLPEIEVIYIDVEENKHIDSAFVDRTFAHLSYEERLIRRTGKFITFLGQPIFNKDMLISVRKYLIENLEVSIPRYGELYYENTIADTFNIINFTDTTSAFPDYPDDNYIWKIWEMPVGELDTTEMIGNRPDYCIGVDPAGDTGGDYTAAYIRRVDTGTVVAALHGRLDERVLAKQLWLAGYFYCSADGKPAMLAIESNNYGKVTIAYLFSGDQENELEKYDRSRLYARPSRSNLELNITARSSDYGWLTTGRTRVWLINNMREGVEKCYYSIPRKDNPDSQCSVPDLGWISEASTFIEDKTGKPTAAATFHDDRLIALAICDEAMKQRFGSVLRIPQDEPEIDDKVTFYDENGITKLNVEGMLRRAKQRKPSGLYYVGNKLGGK